MPTAPKHPCAEAGCAALLPPGTSRCALHAKRPWAGAGQNYGKEWPKLRRQVLAEEPTCRNCGIRASRTVDHIIPKARGGSDARGNLQGLCWVCATAKDIHDAAEGRRLANQRKNRER